MCRSLALSACVLAPLLSCASRVQVVNSDDNVGSNIISFHSCGEDCPRSIPGDELIQGIKDKLNRWKPFLETLANKFKGLSGFRDRVKENLKTNYKNCACRLDESSEACGDCQIVSLSCIKAVISYEEKFKEIEQKADKMRSFISKLQSDQDSEVYFNANAWNQFHGQFKDAIPPAIETFKETRKECLESVRTVIPELDEGPADDDNEPVIPTCDQDCPGYISGTNLIKVVKDKVHLWKPFLEKVIQRHSRFRDRVEERLQTNYVNCNCEYDKQVGGHDDPCDKCQIVSQSCIESVISYQEKVEEIKQRASQMRNLIPRLKRRAGDVYFHVKTWNDLYGKYRDAFTTAIGKWEEIREECLDSVRTVIPGLKLHG